MDKSFLERQEIKNFDCKVCSEGKLVQSHITDFETRKIGNSRFNLQNIHGRRRRIENMRVGGGGNRLFQRNYRPVPVKPDDINGKIHIFHPKSVDIRLWKNKQHAFSVGKRMVSRQSPFSGNFRIGNFHGKDCIIQNDLRFPRMRRTKEKEQSKEDDKERNDFHMEIVA